MFVICSLRVWVGRRCLRLACHLRSGIVMFVFWLAINVFSCAGSVVQVCSLCVSLW